MSKCHFFAVFVFSEEKRLVKPEKCISLPPIENKSRANRPSSLKLTIQNSDEPGQFTSVIFYFLVCISECAGS